MILKMSRLVVPSFKRVLLENRFSCLNCLLSRSELYIRARARSTFSTCNSSLVQSLEKKVGKLFLESENNFAHSILESLPNYAKTTVVFSKLESLLEPDQGENVDGILKNTLWEEIPIDDLCVLFKKVSVDAALNSHLPMSDGRYTEMISSVTGRLKSMSDERLVEMLFCLKLWPMSDSPRAKNLFAFWKEIDNLCLARRRTWDLDKVLYFVDLWFSTHLIRQSDFVFESIVAAGKKCHRLSPSQTVQYLFYLNALRTAHKGVRMYNVEHRLEEVVDSLKIEEIGIALMGFFKTRTPICSEKLVAYLIGRFINEMPRVPEITLSAFLKALRMSLPISLWPMLSELLDSVDKEMERLSLKCSVHVALVATKSKLIHPPTLNKISQKLLDDINNARLKDMEKVLFALTLMDFSPETTRPVWDAVMEELQRPEREKEFLMYPKSLVAVLHYLTLKSMFPLDLLSRVLDIQFIRETYGRTNYVIGREILSIDTCIELECCEYKGPRLSESLIHYLSKRYSTFQPDPQRKLSQHDKLTLDIQKTLEDFMGKEFFVSKYILPNQPRPDFVFHVDGDGKPLVIEESYRQSEDFTGILRPPHGTWRCLVVASKNMFVYDTSRPSGETVSKLRHLQILGYQPLLIRWDEWPSSGRTDKINYLKEKIFS